MKHTYPSPNVLLTGATGTVGMLLAQRLSALNIPFRAMVRSKERAHALMALNGAECVTGDFNDEPTVMSALHGIERAFLLTASSEQAEVEQHRFVDAAHRAGTPHIVKLSQWAADTNSPVRFLRYHAAVEQKIKQSGLPFTFLRPNLFMQGLLGFKETICQKGVFFAAIGDAAISAVDVRDIANVAAVTLTQPDHDGKTYALTGPEALTHLQMAEKLSSALKQPVRFESVSPEAMRDALFAAGFPAWQVDGLIEDYAHYERGEASQVTSDVVNVTSQLPHSFDDFAHDYASKFLR